MHWSIELSLLLLLVAVVVRAYQQQLARTKPWPGFPLIALDGLDPATSWTKHSAETLALGRKLTNNGFYQIMTGNGPKIIVPNRFLEEIRASKEIDAKKGLDAQKAFSTEHFWIYSGMIGFRAMRLYPGPIRHVVTGKISAAMFGMTKEMAVETVEVIKASMPWRKEGAQEWRPVAMQPVCEEIVARLSTLLFLGQEACRNRAWIDIVRSYTSNAFRASGRLRACPPLLRTLAHRFWFAESKIVRAQCADAEATIRPLIKERQRLIDAGEYETSKVGDSLGWLLQSSQRYGQEIDAVGAQMLLTLGAVHNTTETMHAAVLDLCKHPHVVQPLREELVKVLGEEKTWSKNVFAKLTLMDSFLKESQRMMPNNIVPLRRMATRNVELSDGTILPKGAFVTFAGQNMDPAIFRDSHVFDEHRFLRLRGAHNDGNQYTGLSTTIIQFGYGSWACPGRFLAETELKLALAFFLMEFDVELDPNTKEYIHHSAGANLSDKLATIRVRRRDRREMDLTALANSED
ncbi:hypothetical protein CKM354_000006400 [Cercospora kikuchii]|uniref:Cytochrome P450 monooxygenase n=1 Tax=Cercospora kikuchii TaxID=84275 RepID=A0A9P3C377_9PEZI|nr:uncharacterized protein CKM354_000006400 [Cercospora kikuchii]GIZ36594.1 hypothetical protein CKM354_000006400 [Cercospora kikuchii]